MAAAPQSYCPYSTRPEWRDIAAVPLDDVPEPVLAISYTDKYRDIMGYFRAVLRAEEMSERSLALTADAIAENPANYTVWEFRRRIVFSLRKDLRAEIQYVSDLIEANPKNYQVWHHLQLVMERFGQFEEPFLSFIDEQLGEDSKNYHAWSYRHWLVSFFNLWPRDLAYSSRMLQSDVRNNSAWNHRFWVQKKIRAFATDEGLLGEIEFVLALAELAPNNDSAWNYLQGICRSASPHCDDAAISMVSAFLARHSGSIVPALVCKLQLLEDSGRVELDEAALREALLLCDCLIRLDSVRSKFWRSRLKQIGAQHQQT